MIWKLHFRLLGGASCLVLAMYLEKGWYSTLSCDKTQRLYWWCTTIPPERFRRSVSFFSLTSLSSMLLLQYVAVVVIAVAFVDVYYKLLFLLSWLLSIFVVSVCCHYYLCCCCCCRCCCLCSISVKHLLFTSQAATYIIIVASESIARFTPALLKAGVKHKLSNHKFISLRLGFNNLSTA